MKLYKGLYYKDINMIGIVSTFSFSIMLAMIVSMFFSGRLGMFYLFVPTFLFLEFPLSCSWAEDTQGFAKYSASLLMPKKTAVNLRYIQLIINTVIVAVVSETAYYFSCLVKKTTWDYFNSLFIFSTICLIMSILSISLMTILLGHKVLSFMILCVSAGALGGLYGEFGRISISGKTLENVSIFVNTNAQTAVIIVCTLITSFAWLITLWRYPKKDF